MPVLRLILWACLCATFPGMLQAGQAVLHMELGDPARRVREVPVVLDGITDTATGKTVTPAGMAARLADTGLLFVGEEHTSQGFHDVQLHAIRALREAGREVLIGLEMFPYTEQAALDGWNAGRYTAEEFVDQGRWYDHWSYHWDYYRDIFLYARRHGISLYAINSPRELVKSVRNRGFASLTPGEAARLPPRLAPDSDEHQRLYRAFFPPGDSLHMNDDALPGLYRAQTLWDATMGWNALQALRQHGGPKAIMVVLIGSGHVAYGLGSERQVQPHYSGRIASLIPVPVVDDQNQPVPRVRASYASFVWGLLPEKATLYPTLGISLMGKFGKEPGQIIRVEGESVARRAGIQVGDVLLGFNGAPLRDEATLRRLMAPFRWGDQVRVALRRDGKELDVDVPLRRAHGE